MQICCHNCRHLFSIEETKSVDCVKVGCKGDGFPFEDGEMLKDCFDPKNSPEVGRSSLVPGYIAGSEEAFEKHWAKIARCYPRNGGGIDLKSLAHGIWQAAIKFKTAI